MTNPQGSLDVIERALKGAEHEIVGCSVVHSKWDSQTINNHPPLKRIREALEAIQAIREGVPKRPGHAKELYKFSSGNFRNGDGANCNNVFAEEHPGDLVVQIQTNSIGEAHYYGQLIVWADGLLHTITQSKGEKDD